MNMQKLSEYYDALSRWGKALDKHNRQRIMHTIALIPNDVHSVLDVGCGDGAVSNLLIHKYNVFGIDISINALNYFQGRGVVATADRIPFADKCFDVVICAEVLEHLPVGVYEKALMEIERVAKHYIIVTTPNKEHLPSGFARCGYCGCIYHSNFHIRAFDRIMHRNLFREFELLNTINIGYTRYYPFTTWVRQNLLGVYKFKNDLICPVCNCKAKEPALGIIRKSILRGIQLLNKMSPKRSTVRWIASLFRYKGFNRDN